MSIQSVGSSSLVQSVSLSITAKVTETTSASGVGEAATTNVSKPAELMAKLQKLKDSDPDKLKSVLSDISKQLQDAADKTGDKGLAKLADKFASAAQSGDLSGLQPQHHHHGGGHGPRGAGGPQSGGPFAGGPPPGGAQGGSDAQKASWQQRKSELDSVFSNAVSTIDDALSGTTAAAT
jgi:hypothetical protein